MGQQSSHLLSQHGGETQPLLPEDAEEVVREVDHDHDGCFPPHGPHDICPANPYANLPVYTTIHRYASGISQFVGLSHDIGMLADLSGL
jgi:hypothetical protein